MVLVEVETHRFCGLCEMSPINCFCREPAPGWGLYWTFEAQRTIRHGGEWEHVDG